MSVREERQRQARLARDLAAGRPINVVPQYVEPDPPPSSKLDRYVVKSHEDDYLVCRTWNGETEGDTDIYIAKAYLLRRSVFEFTKNGKKTRDGIKYTYGKKKVHWEREAENEDELIEQQIIVPPYVTEKGDDDAIGPDVITAESLRYSITLTIDDEEVKTFLIHIDGREWARKF